MKERTLELLMVVVATIFIIGAAWAGTRPDPKLETVATCATQQGGDNFIAWERCWHESHPQRP